MNAKKIDLILMKKKKGTNYLDLLVRAGSRPIFMRKEERKRFTIRFDKTVSLRSDLC